MTLYTLAKTNHKEAMSLFNLLVGVNRFSPVQADINTEEYQFLFRPDFAVPNSEEGYYLRKADERIVFVSQSKKNKSSKYNAKLLIEPQKYNYQSAIETLIANAKIADNAKSALDDVTSAKVLLLIFIIIAFLVTLFVLGVFAILILIVGFVFVSILSGIGRILEIKIHEILE